MSIRFSLGRSPAPTANSIYKLPKLVRVKSLRTRQMSAREIANLRSAHEGRARQVPMRSEVRESTRRYKASCILLEFVTNAPHGGEVARLGGIHFDFFAQTANMHSHRTRIAIEFITPNFVE